MQWNPDQRTFSIFSRLIISAFLLVAFAVFDPAYAQKPSATGSISGRITIEGRPAANVMVVVRTMYDEGRSITLGGKIRTDGDGRFQIGNLPAGKYSVEPIAPAYIYTDFKERSTYNDAGKVIALGEGEIIRDIELDLQRGGVITGRVTDSEGRPMAAQVVWLMMLEPKIEERPSKARPGEITVSVNRISGDDRLRFIRTAQAITDDRGIYRYYGLLPGRYVVKCGKDPNDDGPRMIGGVRLNTFFPAVYYPAAGSAEEATPVEVAAGAESANIDLRLGPAKRGFQVSGRLVAGAKEEPVTSAVIGADRLGDRTHQGAVYITSARANTRGEFTLTGLDPGRYRIRATVDSGGTSFFPPVPIEVSDHDMDGVVLKLKAGVTISGKLVVENTSTGPLPVRLDKLYVLVSTSDRATGALTSAPLAITADGSFTVTGLTPGDAKFMVINPGKGFGLYDVERNGSRIPGAIIGSEGHFNELPVGFPVDAEHPGTGLVLRAVYGNCVLRGEVKPAGEPWPQPATVFVSISRKDGTGREVELEADALGRFQVDGLRPGDHEIKVSVYPTGDTSEPFYFQGNGSASLVNDTATTVTVTVQRPQRNDDDED